MNRRAWDHPCETVSPPRSEDEKNEKEKEWRRMGLNSVLCLYLCVRLQGRRSAHVTST